VPLTEIGLATRYVNVLAENGITIVGQALERLAARGDDGLLDISGFGRKALIDLKKRLRERGYQLPEAEIAE